MGPFGRGLEVFSAAHEGSAISTGPASATSFPLPPSMVWPTCCIWRMHRLNQPSAIQLALKRPELVTHLVLVASSGGLDVSTFGASDWRPDFLAAFPDTAPWVLAEKPDLTEQLAELKVPALLIGGEKDPISPVAVGRYLASRIPHSKLVILPKGQHSMGMELHDVIAPLIEAHVAAPRND